MAGGVARSPVPNFIGGRPNVVTTVARRRGAGQGGQEEDSRGAPGVSTAPPPRRSPSSLASSRGGGSEKSKNSTNRERGAISKAIDRMAESLATGGASEDSGMMTMLLSNQMNQQAMQHQMFQQV